MTLAPVYDCGSSLYPQADETIMKTVLEDEGERNHRIYNIPTSAIMRGGKKIRYFDFISSLENDGCNRALMRIHPKIDTERIRGVIRETPFMSELQRQFYETMLSERKARILDFSYKALINKDIH